MAPPREAKKPTTTTKKVQNRLSNEERSAYFARREAAKVLRTVLRGDARKRAVGSIKTLVYGPSVRNKKATFALVCQTLKFWNIFFGVMVVGGLRYGYALGFGRVCAHELVLSAPKIALRYSYSSSFSDLRVIKEVLDAAGVLNSRWKRQEELVYVVTYDILFGKEIPSYGYAEKFLLLRGGVLQKALARLLVRMKVKRVEDLGVMDHNPGSSKPRYVRVNTLKIDVESALNVLGEQYMVQKDDTVADLLILPPGTDLHDHPLVIDGSGKGSSMVAAALEPQPGWQVLDACSAPGNKTIHLAALMKNKGKVIACELHPQRAKILANTVRMAGADNVQVLQGDFLKINNNGPKYSELQAILLDPSCSGSGTAADRLDHLLPSGQEAANDTIRLTKLASFQERALKHALSFPSVERIVYSTCSIHQIENEDVIKSVMPIASSNGFHLATPFPQWPRRGLPVFDGYEHLLRMDPNEDGEGFFIALFVKNNAKVSPPEIHTSKCRKVLKRRTHKNGMPFLTLKHAGQGFFRLNGYTMRADLEDARPSSFFRYSAFSWDFAPPYPLRFIQIDACIESCLLLVYDYRNKHVIYPCCAIVWPSTILESSYCGFYRDQRPLFWVLSCFPLRRYGLYGLLRNLSQSVRAYALMQRCQCSCKSVLLMTFYHTYTSHLFTGLGPQKQKTVPYMHA
ncbi:25S rRNA (cytosine-C(5))-methyltransferase NSUN5-like protein [Drosera capensis]